MINENGAADNEYGDVEDDGVDEDDEEDDEGFYNIFFFRLSCVKCIHSNLFVMHSERSLCYIYYILVLQMTTQRLLKLI